MIILIPFSILLFLTTILVSISTQGEISASRHLNDQIVNAISFHHEIIVSREDSLSGLVILKERATLSPLEGLTSFVIQTPSETIIMTWPRRFTTGTDYAAAKKIGSLPVEKMMEIAKNRLEKNGTPGTIDQGPLTPFDGIQYKIGSRLIPFKPPAIDGSPIIVTRLEGP